MTAAEEESEQRLCHCCFEYRLLSEFRRRRKNGNDRMTDCRVCHNRKERERIRPIRQKRRRRRLANKLDVLATERDMLRAAFLIRKLSSQFGAVEELAAEVRGLYEQAQPGSFTRFRVLRLVLSMLEQMAAIRRENDDPGQMTDDELSHALDGHVLRVIRDNPALVLSAAADIGWTVIPPSECQELNSVSDRF